MIFYNNIFIIYLKEIKVKKKNFMKNLKRKDLKGLEVLYQ